jgi:ribosomal protein L29
MLVVTYLLNLMQQLEPSRLITKRASGGTKKDKQSLNQHKRSLAQIWTVRTLHMV